jgi:hypothetical protein
VKDKKDKIHAVSLKIEKRQRNLNHGNLLILKSFIIMVDSKVDVLTTP